MNGSRKLLLTLNAGFAVFSLIWLVGHSTVRVFDWEFWFALAYLALCLTNLGVLAWNCRVNRGVVEPHSREVMKNEERRIEN